jgi:hypothetical protein
VATASRHTFAAAVLALVAGALPRKAVASPTYNTGLETGVCTDSSSFRIAGVGWCNALRADLMLIRDRDRELGLGPMLRLGTARFDDTRVDAGLSIVLPAFESFPIVLDAGPHLRNFRQPGFFGSVFFGLRSFNDYGNYEMATGICVSAERSFGAERSSSIWLTARIDGSWIALPFVFAYNALR